MLPYNCRNVQRLSIIIVGVGLLNSLACAGFPKFEYHQIARIGNKMGQTSLVDVGNDGDLDVFSGGGPLTESPPHKWFIRENKDGRGIRWVQHEILSGKRCHEAKAVRPKYGGTVMAILTSVPNPGTATSTFIFATC